MGIFIGKEILIKRYNDRLHNNTNLIKGIEGEYEVSRLLEKYLPNDTYFIYHPTIGNSEPDFLVISPRYGFRLIEVKNWSLHSIKEAKINGSLQVGKDIKTPINQLKIANDDLHSYLSSSFSHLPNLYESIGFAVIHYGFSSKEFKQRFNTINWKKKQSNYYFKFHLFKDQLNFNLDDYFMNAIKKYPSNNDKSIITDGIIKDIVNDFRFTKKYDAMTDAYFYQTNQQLSHIANILEKKSEELKVNEELAEYTTSKPNSNMKSKLKFIVIASLAILFIAIIALTEYISNTETSNMNYEVDRDNTTIKVQASVIDFYYDYDSGTKFLTLDDGEQIIDAIIFKDTKVPFIEVGNSYTFLGSYHKYENNVQLQIYSLD